MGYRPRIRRGGTTYDLPMPLLAMGEAFSRRVRTTEIPLQDGLFATESTRGALQLNFNGSIIVGNQQDNARAIGMVATIMAERDLMIEHLNGSDEPFIFYRYIPAATLGGVEYGDTVKTRWYKDCWCTNLSFDFSNRTVVHLPYSFTLLVPDGVEWVYTPP